VFWFFMAFIASCGIGHLVEASMFWWPGYRLSAVLKVATAGISWVTVIALVPLIPKALAVPSLKKDNEALKHTLDERERMRSELERAHAKLQRHSDEMEQLIYAVSHDLKAPVFTIVSMLGLADRARESGNPEQAVELMSKVKGACNRLRGSLESLVEFGRVGHAVVELGDVELRSVIDDVLSGLAGSINESRAIVRVSGPMPVIEGDVRSVKAAVQNLVANAVKHGGRGRRPSVWVSVEEGDGLVRIVVEDDGPGVPEAHRSRVFELFERLERSEVEGSGIGLALVRQVADLHQGRVWVEDRDGGGARFVLELPVEQEHEGVVGDEA
jgi:signal transduction histidine kinase